MDYYKINAKKIILIFQKPAHLINCEIRWQMLSAYFEI